jgi:tubulin--tyrosine ligase
MITNDDGPPGLYAPFFLPFTRAYKKYLNQLNKKFPQLESQSFVCVPSENNSWVGKSITRFSKIQAQCNWQDNNEVKVDNSSDEIKYWSTVSGTPATAVNVGLSSLAPFPIDLVISGPNFGRNTGRSFILSSGTVGAALESSLSGKRAIALSFAFFKRINDYTQQDIQIACELAIKIIEQLYRSYDDCIDCFNVNIPLGVDYNANIYFTHVLQDYYGSLYAMKSDNNSQSNSPSSRAKLISNPNSPHPHPNKDSQHFIDTTNNENLSLQIPTIHNSSPPQHNATHSIKGTNLPSLSTRTIHYHFNVNMHKDESSVASYLGSDLWAVKNGHVSVTPLNATLQEVDLTNTTLNSVYPVYNPSQQQQEQQQQQQQQQSARL